MPVKTEKLAKVQTTLEAHHKFMSEHEKECCQADFDRLINCQTDPSAGLHWLDGGRFMADDDVDEESDDSEEEEKVEVVELRPRTNLGRQILYSEEERRRVSAIGQFVVYQFHYLVPQANPEPFRVGRLVATAADGYVKVRHYHSAYRRKGARWKADLKRAKFRIWTGSNQFAMIHRQTILDTFDGFTKSTSLPGPTCNQLAKWMAGESGDVSCEEEGGGVDAVDLDDSGLEAEDSEEEDDASDDVVSSPVPRSKKRKAGRGGRGRGKKRKRT
jgi:hypothetical protein